MKMEVHLFVFLSFVALSAGFIAYDCNGSRIQKTTVSLVETPSCTFELENVTESEVAVAVTQSALTQEIPFYRCLIVAYHHIWRCGSVIDTNVQGGDYAEVIRTTKSECEEMINHKKYKTIGGNSVSIDLPPGGRTSFSYTSWGQVKDSGSCVAGPILYSGGTRYDQHTRNTRLEILYTRGVGRVAVEKKSLIMPNGMQCNVALEECELADYGQVFWKQPVPSCQNEVEEQSLVYKGPATLITNQNTSERFIQVSFSGHHFQIKLEDRTTYICGFRSFFTEHPKLYITLLDLSYPDFPLKENTGTDVNMMNYINSKLVYSMRHIKEQVMTLYRLFELERCLMQNRITSNLLTLAILSPREFAYQYYGEPGYTAVVRGEVVHIARCTPVPVTPRKTELCYNELPVSFNNKSLFMTPRSRILMEIGTVVECATDVGPQFKTANRWITMVSHGLISVEKPNIITPDPITYHFETLEDMLTGGLYTKETIANYQQILTSPMEESILSSRVTTAIRGGESLPSGYPASNIFSSYDIERLRVKVTSGLVHTMDKLLVLGNWFSVFVMIGWAINTLISIINCGLNYYVVKPETSGIFALLTCCFSAIFQVVKNRQLGNPEETKTLSAVVQIDAEGREEPSHNKFYK